MRNIQANSIAQKTMVHDDAPAPADLDSSVTRGNEAKRKKKLLFVSNAFSYGGSEKHLLELLTRLPEANVESVVLCIDSDPFTERLAEGARAHVRVRQEKSLKSLRDWRRIFKEIHPEAIVFVYGTLWMIPEVAVVAARLSGVKRLCAIHHLMPAPPPEARVARIKTLRDVWRRVLGRRVRRILAAQVLPHLCDRIICVSDAVRNSLIAQYRFPAGKTLTIHNGISAREFAGGAEDRTAVRRRLGIPPEDFTLVCTARLSPEKGIDILLSAIDRVIRRGSVCRCIVVGDGHLRGQLLEQANALGLQGHVFFEGFQSQVQPYLSAADAFVLTSHIEGLPFSVLEAMACGLPCIVTDVGGNSEAVTGNRNGIVIRPGSVSEVEDAILYLFAHPEERARMGQQSRERVWNEFDMDCKMAETARALLG